LSESTFSTLSVLAVAMNQDDNRQAHGGFGRGHDDHEKNEHLSLQLAERPAEGDKRQIDGVEHQLDGHENGDDVALEDERHHTQSEQDGAQHQKIRSRNHNSPRWFRSNFRTSEPKESASSQNLSNPESSDPQALSVPSRYSSGLNRIFAARQDQRAQQSNQNQERRQLKRETRIRGTAASTDRASIPPPAGGVICAVARPIQYATSTRNTIPSGTPTNRAMRLMLVRSSSPRSAA
jgi:hypothetical protein